MAIAGYATYSSLVRDLKNIGVRSGDGLFVHCSLGAVGTVVGGARAMIKALLYSVGEPGLLAMPGFSNDAYFPSDIDKTKCSEKEISDIEQNVMGFDRATSSASAMGAVAETFRNWPGTLRSNHPTSSICIYGPDANEFIAPHPHEWGTGINSPMGRLSARKDMKILLIGVGWNRCTALHVAETLAENKRIKTRRFKSGEGSSNWLETPDVADDMGRLFPAVGAQFEDTGRLNRTTIGNGAAKLCGYADLITFATQSINRANLESGDTR